MTKREFHERSNLSIHLTSSINEQPAKCVNYELLLPRTETIPKEIAQIPAWLCWVAIEDPNNPDKFKKVPVDRFGKACNAHESKNHRSFADACIQFSSAKQGFGWGALGGIAIDLPNQPRPVSSNVDGVDLFLIGFDWDHCVKKVNGKREIHNSVKADLRKLGMPYFELSPSGNGLRAFALCEEPLNAGNLGNYEQYGRGRFLTVTGRGGKW